MHALTVLIVITVFSLCHVSHTIVCDMLSLGRALQS